MNNIDKYVSMVSSVATRLDDMGVDYSDLNEFIELNKVPFSEDLNNPGCAVKYSFGYIVWKANIRSVETSLSKVFDLFEVKFIDLGDDGYNLIVHTPTEDIDLTEVLNAVMYTGGSSPIDISIEDLNMSKILLEMYWKKPIVDASKVMKIILGHYRTMLSPIKYYY